MGLFDWMAAPKAAILYTDEKGQHQLTAEQYGEKCVNWAKGMGQLKTQQLVAFGKVRNEPDLIAKLRQEPFIATAHGTAFFAAVYCAYPVIRLGISNELFKGIMQGAYNAFLKSSNTSEAQPSSTEYLNQLGSEFSQYSAVLLETAGMASQPDQDRMLFGIRGASHRLFDMLELQYAEVEVPPTEVVVQINAVSSGGNEGEVSHSTSPLTSTRSIVPIDPIRSEDILKWLDTDARTRLISALAKRLGVNERSTPGEIQRLEQIADQNCESIKTILSNAEPTEIEERVKAALVWSLEAIGRKDEMDARLKAKLATIQCIPTNPISSPKVMAHTHFVEATRSKDPQALLIGVFVNSATEFVNGVDDKKSLVLLS